MLSLLFRGFPIDAGGSQYIWLDKLYLRALSNATPKDEGGRPLPDAECRLIGVDMNLDGIMAIFAQDMSEDEALTNTSRAVLRGLQQTSMTGHFIPDLIADARLSFEGARRAGVTVDSVRLQDDTIVSFPTPVHAMLRPYSGSLPFIIACQSASRWDARVMGFDTIWRLQGDQSLVDQVSGEAATTLRSAIDHGQEIFIFGPSYNTEEGLVSQPECLVIEGQPAPLDELPPEPDLMPIDKEEDLDEVSAMAEAWSSSLEENT